MRYIRMRDRIFVLHIDEEKKNNNILKYYYVDDLDVDWRFYYYEKEIKKYKQSTSIKKLCDAFVQVHLDGTKDIYEYFPESDWLCHYGDQYYSCLFNNFGNYDGEFYGAIWTNRGLIYVCKMNDKKELKLL